MFTLFFQGVSFVGYCSFILLESYPVVFYSLLIVFTLLSSFYNLKDNEVCKSKVLGFKAASTKLTVLKNKICRKDFLFILFITGTLVGVTSFGHNPTYSMMESDEMLETLSSYDKCLLDVSCTGTHINLASNTGTLPKMNESISGSDLSNIKDVPDIVREAGFYAVERCYLINEQDIYRLPDGREVVQSSQRPPVLCDIEKIKDIVNSGNVDKGSSQTTMVITPEHGFKHSKWHFDLKQHYNYPLPGNSVLDMGSLY